MKKRPSRLPITVPAVALFLVIALTSSPSTPSVPHPSQAIPQAQLQGMLDLQRMAGWAVGAPRLKALRNRDLDSALGEDPGVVGLFRREAHDVAQELAPERRLLADLPFGEAIGDAAERHQVDGLLVAAVVETESSFSARALSPRGAKGLMQVMPGTGRDVRRHEGEPNLFDPHVNLEVGCRYLGSLIEHYDGDLTLALAAYNAGPATVARYGGVPPYRETRDYVERVLSRYSDHQQSAAELASAGEGQSALRRAEARTGQQPAVLAAIAR